MNSLALHTTATNTNALLAMSSLSSIDKKINSGRTLVKYFTTSRNSSKKAPGRFIRIDWDANMNELEFE